jgi:hypothetical protein
MSPINLRHLPLTETVVTDDEPFSLGDGTWGTRIKRRYGPDWCVVDYLSSEKKTSWQRRRQIVPSRGRRP